MGECIMRKGGIDKSKGLTADASKILETYIALVDGDIITDTLVSHNSAAGICVGSSSYSITISGLNFKATNCLIFVNSIVCTGYYDPVTCAFHTKGQTNYFHRYTGDKSYYTLNNGTFTSTETSFTFNTGQKYFLRWVYLLLGCMELIVR